MESYLTKLVIAIDAILFTVIVSLSLIVIAYAILKQITEKKRQTYLQRAISDFRSVILDGEELDKVSQIKKTAQKARNKWRRIEAIITLGYLDLPLASDILKKSLIDKDEDIAYFSILSLGRIKTAESARALLEVIRNRTFSGYKIASVLETFPPNIVGEVIEATQDTDPILRFWAIKLLSRFKPKEYTDRIGALTKDKLPDIRAAACECLGDIAGKSLEVFVKECLNDSVWFVRVHAIRALEKISGADSVPDLVNLIRYDNWFIQENIKKVMTKYINQSLPHIERLLWDDDKSIRKVCLEILDVSGHTNRVLQDVISENSEARDTALLLLKGMLNADAHFGLETFLSAYPPDIYIKILNEIAAIDKEKAEHIDKKIKGEIGEV